MANSIFRAWLAPLLAAGLLAMALSACGGSGSPATPPNAGADGAAAGDAVGQDGSDAGADGAAAGDAVGQDGSDAGVDGAAAGDAAPPSDAGDSATATSILANCGVSTASVAPPIVNATGQSVDPATWQPLKNPTVAFSPRSRVFQAGGTYGTSANTMFEDALSTPPYSASTAISGDQAWAQTSAKTSLNADVDGDGVDEIVLLYAKTSTDTNLYVRVYHLGTFSAEAVVPGVTLSGKSFQSSLSSGGSTLSMGASWFPYFDSAKGDLDGDGKQEIFVVDYDTVHILSLTDAGVATLRDSKTFAGPVSNVAAGSFKGDRKDEFLVAWVAASSAQYALYDSAFAAPLMSPGSLGDAFFAEAGFGNFYGNNTTALALAYQSRSTGTVYAIMFDYAAPPASPLHEVRLQQVTSNPGITQFRLLPRGVDLDGTGRDKLHLVGWVFDTPMATSTDWEVLVPHSSSIHTTLRDVQVGDIDHDGKQDLVYLQIDPYQLGGGPYNIEYIAGFGLDATGSVVPKANLAQGAATSSTTGFGETCAIAVGSYADDAALRVHYVGHTLRFTDPIVMAVIASAPYWSDVAAADTGYAGSLNNWSTAYGMTSSTDSDKTHSLGFSVGASVEFEHDFTIPILAIEAAKVKASVAFTSHTSWEWQTTYEVEKSIQYNAWAGADNVVFTAVPMDEYQYVIDQTQDPTRNPVGKSIYISIPRAYKTYMVTKDFYNSCIGTGVIPPIDGSIFAHAVGNPFSYPTSDQKNALLSTYFPGDAQKQADYQYAAQPVAEGSGVTSLTVSVTSGQSETVSQDFSLEASVGVGVGDWTVTASAGFEVGYSATSSTSAGTTFAGTVGYLPTAYYLKPSYNYQAGLFAYPYKTPVGKSIWVVDYFVCSAGASCL